ncbi:MAG: YCF48-related protein [bacterium]
MIYTGGYIYNGSTYVMAVSKSTDGGTFWERDTLTTGYCICYALAIDRSNFNMVYAGGYNGYLFKTTNGGVNWNLSNTGLSGTVYDIKIASTKANTVYAGTSSGVYKSTNAGANWTSTGLSANVLAILINPSNENEIYAATSNGIYKSTTGGGGWTQMNTGLLTTNTTSLGIYPNNWLFCGTDGSGIYRWNIQVGAEESDTQNVLQKIALVVTPNPFQNHLTIRWQIGDRRKQIKDELPSAICYPLSVMIYDISGRLVKQFNHLTNYQSSIIWFGDDNAGHPVPAGVYFIQLDAGDLRQIEKVILLR